MTYEEYIKNPMGSGTTVMTNRTVYHDMYNEKWDTLMVREDGEIGYNLYKKDEEYYIHLKIPSESLAKFYYDVVIRFFLPLTEKVKSMEQTISNYQVQFYSNDPNFIYTFAHAFKKNKMLIKDLEFKMSAIALKEKAIMKNPKDEMGYVKSLYFAYIIMKNLNLFNKSRWNVAKPYSKSVWNSTIRHADETLKEWQELKRAEEKKNKKEEAIKSNQSINTSKSPNIPNFGHFKKTIKGKADSVVKLKDIGKFKHTIGKK